MSTGMPDRSTGKADFDNSGTSSWASADARMFDGLNLDAAEVAVIDGRISGGRRLEFPIPGRQAERDMPFACGVLIGR